MPQPQPLTVGKGKTIAIYGIPGAGKTRLIGTGPNTLIIRPPDDHTDSIEVGADVEEIIADTWSDMFELFADLQQGRLTYDWVWLDSISLMQDRLLEDVMDEVLMRRPDRFVDKGGIKVPEFGPDQGEYKVNFDRLAKWVRDMVGEAKAGKFNFGWTAHPFEWHDPVQEKDVWAPWIQGKNMSPKLCGYMNIVAYLQELRTDDGTKRALLVDLPGFVGKDQLFCMPELKSGRHGIVEPTMDKLIKAIGGEAKTPRRRKAPRRKK